MAQTRKIPKGSQAFLLILSVLLLSLITAALSGNRLRFPDELEYHQLALSLASGDGFVLENGRPTAYRPPGYPFFLSLFYRFSAYPLTAKLANGLLLTATVWLMSRLCARSPLPRLFVLAYPVLFFNASTLYPQTLAGFLLLTVLFLLYSPRPGIPHVLMAGGTLGFLILCVPSFLLTAPVLAWILFRSYPGAFPHRIKAVALLTLFTLIMVAPWSYRNYRKFDAFIPVSANSGLNLFVGNSPNAGPGTGVNVPRSEILEAVRGLDEIETDRFYRDQSLSWIRQNPGRAGRLYLAKCLNYFHFSNQLETSLRGRNLMDLLMFVTWFPLLAVFCLRPFSLKSFPLSPLEKSLYLLVITNVFLSALFFTRIRFRLPFDLLMILANAHFVYAFRQTRPFFGLKPLTKPEIPL